MVVSNTISLFSILILNNKKKGSIWNQISALIACQKQLILKSGSCIIKYLFCIVFWQSVKWTKFQDLRGFGYLQPSDHFNIAHFN